MSRTGKNIADTKRPLSSTLSFAVLVISTIVIMDSLLVAANIKGRSITGEVDPRAKSCASPSFTRLPNQGSVSQSSMRLLNQDGTPVAVDNSKISLKISDINHNIIDISAMKGKTILFVFFDPMNTAHKESISYVQVLHRRFRQKGFEVIGISNRDMNTTRELFAYGHYSFPFVSDEKGAVYQKFQMKSCCGGVVLINNKTEIIFKMPNLLSSEDLRQLAEKEIFGKISYSFTSAESVNDEIRKKKILSLSLLDISTSRVTDLKSMEQKPLVATFISTFCSFCKSGKRIETLKRVSEQWGKEGKNVDIILIFSKPYMERDILEIGNRMDLPFGKYISMEDVFTEEEKYITDESLKSDPLTVVINQDQSMDFVERIGMKEEEIGARLTKIIEGKRTRGSLIFQ